MQLLLAKLLSFTGKYCILITLEASIACQNVHIFEKKHLSIQTRKRGHPYERGVTKRFLLYFRLMLLVWILIANAIIHLTGMEYSWLIFLSNIMMFTLEGDVKDRLVTVELGGLVGLVLTVAALLSISALTPVLGDFLGFILPLAVVLFILIILHPYAPKVLNNVGFAYLTVACIDIPALTAHLPQFFIIFIVGSVLFNGVCVLLMKPAKALAVRSVEKQGA